MMIHKIIPSVDYNSWLKRLDTQLNELTYQNLIKVPKRYHKPLRTSEINSPMSPPSLISSFTSTLTSKGAVHAVMTARSWPGCANWQKKWTKPMVRNNSEYTGTLTLYFHID